MARNRIDEGIRTRNNELLESIAESYISEGHWSQYLRQMQRFSPFGKARDALVHLLDLESVGGTDSDIFKEFTSLSGANLDEIRADAVERAMDLLRSQIKVKNTFFIDTERMTTSPFVLLFDEVTESRLSELEVVSGNPTRNELLKTFYGFTLLTMGGNSNETENQSYRYWRRRRFYTSQPRLETEVKKAITQIMQDLSSEIHLNDRYETLGSSLFLADKCTRDTSKILADIVRLTLYMTPWDRGKAAFELGGTGDSRVLEFLHHRIQTEPDMKTKAAIARAIGGIGDPSSYSVLMNNLQTAVRFRVDFQSACVEAIGKIFTDESTEFLKSQLMRQDSKVIEAAIEGLARRDLKEFHDLLSPLLRKSSKVIVRKATAVLLEAGRQGRQLVIKNAPSIVNKLYNNRPSRDVMNRLLSLKEVQQNEEVQKFFARKLRNLHDKRMKAFHRVQQSWWTGRILRRYNQQLYNMITLLLQHYGSPLPWEFDKIIREILSNVHPNLRIPIQIAYA